VATATWEAAIQKDLKGADYEKKLVWRSDEGIAVRPYYRREALTGLEVQIGSVPGQFPFVRGDAKAWEINQNATPGAEAIRVDLVLEAGADAIQQVGIALAAGVERLVRLCEDRPVDVAAREIEFVFAVGSTYFIEIAKLRAARMAWAQAVTAFAPSDLDSCRMNLHVRTARLNKSDRGMRDADGAALWVRRPPGAGRTTSSGRGSAPERSGGPGRRLLLHRGLDQHHLA
jgi:methylmalonyl-CoA mutase